MTHTRCRPCFVERRRVLALRPCPSLAVWIRGDAAVASPIARLGSTSSRTETPTQPASWRQWWLGAAKNDEFSRPRRPEELVRSGRSRDTGVRLWHRETLRRSRQRVHRWGSAVGSTCLEEPRTGASTLIKKSPARVRDQVRPVQCTSYR